MAHLALNKSSLQKRTRDLKTYERYLPSLDLKRRQLLTERNTERAKVVATQAAMAELKDEIAARLPMLGDQQIDLTELVSVVAIEVYTTNFLGTCLPVLKSTHINIRKYALLARPFWVDVFTMQLKTMLELAVLLKVQEQRLQQLEQAVQHITQRVNLFEKVLIPRARADIKQIRIYLSDADRAAVVRAKIAKRKIDAR